MSSRVLNSRYSRRRGGARSAEAVPPPAAAREVAASAVAGRVAGPEAKAGPETINIRFTDTLPKTRSGKIMRRLLRDIAAGKEIGQDTSTLEDYSVLAKLRADEE